MLNNSGCGELHLILLCLGLKREEVTMGKCRHLYDEELSYGLFNRCCSGDQIKKKEMYK